MRARLVVGNWKMLGSLAANQRLLEAVKGGASGASGVEIAVCVPFPYLQQAANALAGSSIAWGGQTLSEHDSGAFTGEVSGAMLRDLGCRCVIVGHSEDSGRGLGGLRLGGDSALLQREPGGSSTGHRLRFLDFLRW